MTNYAVQEQNQDLVSLLAAHFRLLYNPTHALVDSLGIMRMFPGVAGIWSTAVTASNGRLTDVSGNGLNFTANNTPQFGTLSGLLAPFIRYSAASSQYHSLPSAIGSTTDITGAETHIRSEVNGMTVCCVVSFSTVPASIFHIMSKSVAGANSWILSKSASNNIEFTIYNGASATGVSSSVTVTTGQQYIITARFDPSTALSLRVNNDEQSNVTSIPATIDSTATPLTIGARSTPELYLNGTYSLGGLMAANVPSSLTNLWYRMTAPLFGISV